MKHVFLIFIPIDARGCLLLYLLPLLFCSVEFYLYKLSQLVSCTCNCLEMPIRGLVYEWQELGMSVQS
jgi:hypothetical protein